MANAALSLGRPPSSFVLLLSPRRVPQRGSACHLATISSRHRRKQLSRPRLARPWPLGLTRVLFLRRIGPVPFIPGSVCPDLSCSLSSQSHVSCAPIIHLILAVFCERWLGSKHIKGGNPTAQSRSSRGSRDRRIARPHTIRDPAPASHQRSGVSPLSALRLVCKLRFGGLGMGYGGGSARRRRENFGDIISVPRPHGPCTMDHDHADGRTCRERAHAPPRRTVRGFIAFKALERAAADRQRGWEARVRRAEPVRGRRARPACSHRTRAEGHRAASGIPGLSFDPAKSRPARRTGPVRSR